MGEGWRGRISHGEGRREGVRSVKGWMERDAGTGGKSYSGAAAVGGVIRVSLISLELGRFGGVQVIIEKKKGKKEKSWKAVKSGSEFRHHEGTEWKEKKKVKIEKWKIG